SQILELYPEIKEHLLLGDQYGLWENDDSLRFEYIRAIVERLGSLSKFKLENTKDSTWEEILRWWLNPASGIGPKTASQISEWYDDVSKNFIYKFNWGLGSIVALA